MKKNGFNVIADVLESTSIRTRRDFTKDISILASMAYMLGPHVPDENKSDFLQNIKKNYPKSLNNNFSNNIHMKNTKEYSVATYNHAFGGDGRKFLEVLKDNLLLLTAKYKKVIDRTSIYPTLEVIRKVGSNGADIVSIQEILGLSQFSKFEKEFEKLNYSDVHYSPGHVIGHPIFSSKKPESEHEHVGILLATKKPSTQLPFDNITTCLSNGCGGEVIQAKLDDLMLTALHMPLPQRREYYNDKLALILESLDKYKDNKQLLMGDFNVEYNELINLAPKINDTFKKITPDEYTVPLTTIAGLSLYYKRCFDYILATPQIESVDSGVDKDVPSDHALVWARVRC